MQSGRRLIQRASTGSKRPAKVVARSGAFLFALIALLVACLSLAGQERYDYDPLGRLVRSIDEQGRSTEYIYDAVTNLLRVVTGAAAQKPVVSAISPASIRRGESKQFTLSGSSLSGVQLSIADPGLTLSGVTTTATQITFSLAVAASAALGTQAITLSNAAGSSSTSINVAPLLPTLQVDPTPLAIPPDHVARQITLRLSHADTVSHALTLSVSNALISISPTNLSIAAGQTQAQASITGLATGQATLTLASATLGNTVVPVFVTGDFRGLSTSYAPTLGVVLQFNPQPNATQISPLAASNLGVAVGAFIREVAPKNFSVGSGPTTLTLTGVGLQAAQSLVANPATGLSFGALSVSADGTAVRVPLTVAADALLGMRKLVLSGTSGAYPALPGADRINIARLPPQIVSIDPIAVAPDSLVQLTVRGQRLQDAIVSLSPGTGIVVDTTPVISADGSSLTAMLAIKADAAIGARAVVITTPGGATSATTTPANTLSVVNSLVQTITPVLAQPLGLVLPGQSSAQTAPLFAHDIGVALGRVITGVDPAVGIIGQTISLTLRGQELQGVDGLRFLPNTGLSPGAITVAVDGRSMSLPLTVAADAPQTVRKLIVSRGAVVVPFASPQLALFPVSAPGPVLESVEPILLPVGKALQPLTLRGRNLQNATTVSMVPPEGVSVTAPSAGGDPNQFTVSISAEANAALGPRTVIVATPAGSSSTTPAAANTLTLTNAAGQGISPLVAPSIGIVKQENTPAPPLSIGPILATSVGVVVQDTTVPPAQSRSAVATNVGVALGPVATGLSPTGFAPGSSGTLSIGGYALAGVSGITVRPNTGITLGTPSVATDGRQVSVPITIASDAPATVREVRLSTASGTIVFSNPAASRFAIGVGVPRFDSISPILAAQATTLTLTVRGSKLTGAIAVTATPAAGITFSTTPLINDSGTQLTVDLYIAPDAALGSRVIQVLAPGAASDATATPFNTFTVIAP